MTDETPACSVAHLVSLNEKSQKPFMIDHLLYHLMELDIRVVCVTRGICTLWISVSAVERNLGFLPQSLQKKH